MKGVDNSDKQRDVNRKRLVIGGCAGLVCIVAVIAISLPLGRGNDDTAVVDGQIENDQEMWVDDRESVQIAPSNEDVEKNANNFQDVINYTSVDADEDSLIQLVKNTIMSANIQLQDARDNGELRRTANILNAVEDAWNRNALNDRFTPLVDCTPLGDENVGWSYYSVASAVGNLLFYGEDLERGELYRSNMLKHFVGQGVYNFDIDSLEEFKVLPLTDATYSGWRETEYYDVDSLVYMTHGDIRWVAIVGRVEQSYKVLDIIDERLLSGYVQVEEDKNPDLIMVRSTALSNEEYLAAGGVLIEFAHVNGAGSR